VAKIAKQNHLRIIATMIQTAHKSPLTNTGFDGFFARNVSQQSALREKCGAQHFCRIALDRLDIVGWLRRL
jgi:hypothetical protein